MTTELNKHVREVCKVGQGHDCCRYLAASAAGWQCMKLIPEPEDGDGPQGAGGRDERARRQLRG
jgi:hypothetical protein